MFRIQNLTSDAKQKQNLVLPDGSQIFLSLYFCPLQQGWFIPTLTYKNFTLNGLRISNSPNMLHQFRNQIPFGLCCVSIGEREPGLQKDFFSEASKLFVLSAAEVQAYTEFLNGQI